jgi:hypothetical protein
MDWPYKFPHPADVIAEEANRFRKLPPAEQVGEIMEMVDVGERQLAASPRRDAILARIDADERAWQEAHRRVFQKHGK